MHIVSHDAGIRPACDETHPLLRSDIVHDGAQTAECSHTHAVEAAAAMGDDRRSIRGAVFATNPIHDATGFNATGATVCRSLAVLCGSSVPASRSRSADRC